MNGSNAVVDKLIETYIREKSFKVTSIEIDDINRKSWVRVKVDPDAFRKKMFDGSWSLEGHHPSLGTLRILRVLTGNDDVTRAIARQGDFLYAYPLI